MYAASILVKLASLNFFLSKSTLAHFVNNMTKFNVTYGISTGKDDYLCRLYNLAGDAAFS